MGEEERGRSGEVDWGAYRRHWVDWMGARCHLAVKMGGQSILIFFFLDTSESERWRLGT